MGMKLWTAFVRLPKAIPDAVTLQMAGGVSCRRIVSETATPYAEPPLPRSARKSSGWCVRFAVTRVPLDSTRSTDTRLSAP